jgi:alpha-amylase
VRPELAPVVANKMLAYAYILTSEGYPCVFYRDYATDPGCYGLKPHIDNLVWVHEKLAEGPTQERWKEVGLFAYERLGGPHLLTALNKDDWQGRVITVDTGFGANVQLHDYTGHAPDTWTNWRGQATISVPANRGGLGYVCFSRNGLGEGFEIREHAVTQELEGAHDLDIPPAGAGAPTVLGRISVEKGKPLTVRLRKLDDARFGAGAHVEVVVRDPDDAVLATHTFEPAGADARLQVKAKKRGWHTLTIQAHGTPAENPTPAFTVAVTYVAPQTL